MIIFINLIVILFFLHQNHTNTKISLPVNTNNRTDVNSMQLTDIGAFALLRSARPEIPAHFHTGIDIKRPSDNYNNEPIFPIADGKVISKREDGPFAQLIIEHSVDNKKFWSVYEHIAGIIPALNDSVFTDFPIARFMNRNELNNYGWQFDHLHFEILKVKPVLIQVNPKNPQRLYNSYSLICYTRQQLSKYFYNPVEFLRQKIN